MDIYHVRAQSHICTDEENVHDDVSGAIPDKKTIAFNNVAGSLFLHTPVMDINIPLHCGQPLRPLKPLVVSPAVKLRPVPRKCEGTFVSHCVLSVGYKRVEVSLFIPRLWARPEDSTGSNFGA